MNVSNTPTHGRRPRVLVVVSVILGIFIAGAIVFLAVHWPFSEARVIQSLQRDVPSTVKIEKFHSRIFPRPGCDAEGVTFNSQSSPPGTPPLAAVQKLSLRARYIDLLVRRGYIARIVLDGLHVYIPPRQPDSGSMLAAHNTAPKKQNGKGTHVGEIVANQSVLEIARRDDKPLRFNIHTLTVNSVGRDERISYTVSMTNAEPAGELRSKGTFGPWQSGDPSKTPVSGFYIFQQADLSVFGGISGTLSSQDQFKGSLGHIDVQGSADVPDFKVRGSSHAVHVSTQFHAIVNATNGDISIENAKAAFLKTVVTGHGNIAGTPNRRGKTTSLDLAVNNGRIEDLLLLFVSGPRAPMTGRTGLHAHATVPPDGRPFLKELVMQGGFGIAGGQFTAANTQESVDRLSERALTGKDSSKNKEKDKGKDGEDEDPERVISSLRGDVVLRDAVANFRGLSFYVPGAFAQMNGTYELLTQRVNFHGTLKSDSSFSNTAGGVKSVLLKPLNVFFKKKPKGSEIPVHMIGTYSKPRFGLDIPKKSNSAKVD